MKIVEFGKKQRYALIVMIKDSKTRISIDNTITYYYSNDLKELRNMYSSLLDARTSDYETILDASIFDYKNMKYCRMY